MSAGVNRQWSFARVYKKARNQKLLEKNKSGVGTRKSDKRGEIFGSSGVARKEVMLPRNFLFIGGEKLPNPGS